MAILPEFYLNAVASIGVRQGENVSWIGTGFFILRIVNEKGDARPMLITNKHVLNGFDCIVLRVREKDGQELKVVEANLVENGKKLYLEHRNENIDIAVLPLNGKFIRENNLEFEAFDIDQHALTSEELHESGVDEGNLVYMLGFPMGLVNIESTLPICRLGCIARMSAAQIKESGYVLVDIQNFPGNSGSPIVTRPEFISVSGTKAFNQSVLVGIICGYIPYTEQLINSQTKQVVEIKSENSGIALMHPVEYIREIVDTVVEAYLEEPQAV